MTDHDAILWIFVAAGLGAAAFAWAGWNPAAGMVVIGLPASLVVATVSAWDEGDE